MRRHFSSRAGGSRRKTTNPNPNAFANQSPYDVLNVAKDATAKDVKLAYYRAAKEHHPDVHGACYIRLRLSWLLCSALLCSAVL